MKTVFGCLLVSAFLFTHAVVLADPAKDGKTISGCVSPEKSVFHRVTLEPASSSSFQVLGTELVDIDCFLYHEGQLLSADTDSSNTCSLSVPQASTSSFELLIVNYGLLISCYEISSR
jgi:hypothetical protein